MLTAAKAWLAELRSGADPRRFAYCEREDPAEMRGQLLLALQYDHSPGDAPLLRLLLDAEREAHARSEYQGLEEGLDLAAWLVATLRDPADVFRLWAAKCANFDTQCGFDGEYLVAAGVARSVAYLRASEDPRSAAILAYLADDSGDCRFSEAEIEDWRAAKAEWFPARETDEMPRTMLERALAFAPEQAPHWLAVWLAGEERGDRTLVDLCHYALQIEDFERAIAVARELVDRAGDGDEVVGAHERLAGVLITAGRLVDAAAALTEAAARAATRSRSAWEQRRLLERWLELAEAARDDLGRHAFARADALFTAGFGHCHDNLRRLAACAAALGETEAATRLAAARDLEGRRLDEQMLRLQSPA